jgi:predicted CoA-binding protein
MNEIDPIADFLAQRRIAVVGASNRREKWGYKIYRYLRDRGHDVFPVHPTVTSIDGARVYRSIEEIERPAPGAPPVDGVDLVVNPTVGIDIARSCKKLGIARIWAQPGAESHEIGRFCEENGIVYIEDCVLVQGPSAPAPR